MLVSVLNPPPKNKIKKRGEAQGPAEQEVGAGWARQRGCPQLRGCSRELPGSLSRFLAPPVSKAPHFIQRGREEKLGGKEGRVFLVLSSSAGLFLSAADSVNAFPGRQLALY